MDYKLKNINVELNYVVEKCVKTFSHFKWLLYKYISITAKIVNQENKKIEKTLCNERLLKMVCIYRTFHITVHFRLIIL